MEISQMNINSLNTKPSAWNGHLEFAGWLIRKMAPRVFVELGSHWGHSYFAFCKSVKDAGLETKCFAVDTWQGDSQAGNYNNEVHETFVSINSEAFSSFSTPLRMTFDEALPLFGEKSVGLLHIDGLHGYGDVKHDFETWLPKMEEEGVVLYHDICERRDDFGVWKYWAELKEEYPNHIEFSHSHGLGVLHLSKKKMDIQEWLKGASPVELGYFQLLAKQQELEEVHRNVQAELSRCTNSNGILENRINRMKSSLSWRLTSPFRKAEQLLRGAVSC